MSLPESLSRVDLFQIATITLVHLEAYQKYGERYSIPILRSLAHELGEYFGTSEAGGEPEEPSAPAGVGDGASPPERPTLEAVVPR